MCGTGPARGRRGFLHDMEDEDLKEYLEDLNTEVERVKRSLARARGTKS